MGHRAGTDSGEDQGGLAAAACCWFLTPWAPATLQLLPTSCDRQVRGMGAFTELGVLEVCGEDRLTNVISDSLSLRGMRGAKTFVSGHGRKEAQNLPEGRRQTGGRVGGRSRAQHSNSEHVHSVFCMPGIVLGIL